VGEKGNVHRNLQFIHLFPTSDIKPDNGDPINKTRPYKEISAVDSKIADIILFSFGEYERIQSRGSLRSYANVEVPPFEGGQVHNSNLSANSANKILCS
jgi:hypothetical protein